MTGTTGSGLVLLLTTLQFVWGFHCGPGSTPASFSVSSSLKATEPKQVENVASDKNSGTSIDNLSRVNAYENAYMMPAGTTPYYHDSLQEKGTFLQKLFGLQPNDPRVEVYEDGYGDMRSKQRPLWKRALQAPIKAVNSILFRKPPIEPGTLILVRHGESSWNANKTFTGWADPDLSERGYREVEHAARLLLEGGYEIDLIFCSRLKRSIRSVWLILQGKLCRFPEDILF